MTEQTFQALVVRETADNHFTRTIETRSIDTLPPGDVLIRVHYSSLNYKDGLSASGNKGVTRTYPHTPGVDAAGVVAASDSPDFAVGDEVIVIGYDLGMNTSGGFGQYIRVPAGWVVKRPSTLTLRESMILGTAGFTAAMCVERLVGHGLTPDNGEILVTGATGGVGSVAVALLAHLGYTVVAVTGKADKHAFLRELGANEVVGREAVQDDGKRPLLRTRWAGVVDCVGGEMLAHTLKTTNYGGAVACCGLVASPNLATTVFPFILRGLTLYGIDSVQCDISLRPPLWAKLGGAWHLNNLEALATERTLGQLDAEIELILQGQQTGRVLVKL
ncbi:MAG: YhdH/YhfP family quinone oxidoreductase [Ardenticatenaceae bacterium]|nr:YhdH/YhfP family quinone oxidoreductase [Ardenticatenaceae bacterium]